MCVCECVCVCVCVCVWRRVTALPRLSIDLFWPRAASDGRAPLGELSDLWTLTDSEVQVHIHMYYICRYK